MPASVKGWHPGEVVVQKKLGYADAVRDRYVYIEDIMREQHRIFHTSNLPFIPVTAIDEEGRPWAGMVAGATGEIGFVKSPDANTLTINARLWEGDPLMKTAKAWINPKDRQTAFSERFLTAGLGIEFPTRRRNKFGGYIRGIKQLSKRDYEIDVYVNQALGNCPKYINIRQLLPYPNTSPSIAHKNLRMGPDDRLPDEVIKFITEADTVFIASLYNSDPSTADMFPSQAGMNARGGLPGFTRVSPTDGRTVVVPEFSGNRFLSSLGNVYASGLVGFSMASFTTGDVIYMTGTAKVLVGPDAFDIMPRQGCLVAMYCTGYTFVRDALPVRQDPETEVERSPYSPKIKFLHDESDALGADSGAHKAKLVSAVQFAEDIATFTFEVTSKPGADILKIRPGQAIALDFMDWIGPPVYHHMADDDPGSINDDRVRTWTVSSAQENESVSRFDLTMREMKGGVVTGALFNVLRAEPKNKWNHPVRIETVEVIAEVAGVTGDFYLGTEDVRMLWVAGGIGITPFLSMLAALVTRGPNSQGDIIFVLSTREPDTFLGLIELSLIHI